MRVKVEIPVKIDGPLTADERKQFRDYLQSATENEFKEFIERKFGPGPRMFTTICRFAFGEMKVEVE